MSAVTNMKYTPLVIHTGGATRWSIRELISRSIAFCACYYLPISPKITERTEGEFGTKKDQYLQIGARTHDASLVCAELTFGSLGISNILERKSTQKLFLSVQNFFIWAR
uniref:Uncharacterized protein n=1 Tax=Photinus pyralis TaxID=7054 RepID=A0A1Y1NDH1_PHOPY